MNIRRVPAFRDLVHWQSGLSLVTEFVSIVPGRPSYELANL